jgi:hypothetical protein
LFLILNILHILAKYGPSLKYVFLKQASVFSELMWAVLSCLPSQKLSPTFWEVRGRRGQCSESREQVAACPSLHGRSMDPVLSINS